MKEKRKFFTKFRIFLIIYSLLICIAITVGIIWLHGLLKDYEAGIPSGTMDEVMDNFSEDNLPDFLEASGIEGTEFDSIENICSYLISQISDNDVYYRKKAGEFSENSPVYVVYAGDKAIAKVSLSEKRRNKHDFIEWELGEVSVEEYLPKKSLSITVPKGSNVYFNDVYVRNDYIVEDDVKIDACENISEYASVPYNTAYTVDGLILDPDIKVMYYGKELPLNNGKDMVTAGYPTDEELFAEQKSNIINVMENYAKYMINRGDLSHLKSYMVGNAAKSISDVKYIHVYLLGKSYTYDIGNESVSDFVKYNDSCFSCNVKCDLHVEYSSGDYTDAGETTYNIDMIYTFVKIGSNWKLADFSIN